MTALLDYAAVELEEKIPYSFNGCGPGVLPSENSLLN